jgi:hypothetical protein
MIIKRAILTLIFVYLFLTVTALAEYEPGDLDAPIDLTVEVNDVDDVVDCNWADVDGAEKYSVYIIGLAIFDHDEDPITEDVTQVVSDSFGTGNRTDGGDMGDSDLTIPFADLAAAIAAKLGVPAEDLTSFDGFMVKVRGLNSGNGREQQNNRFSYPEGPFTVVF